MLKQDRGQSMVEVSLLISGIALACLITLTPVGRNLYCLIGDTGDAFTAGDTFSCSAPSGGAGCSGKGCNPQLEHDPAVHHDEASGVTVEEEFATE